MIHGCDISNHQNLPSAYRGQPWYRDASFLIVQAIPRPAPNGYTAQQLRAAVEDGKHAGIYTWLWHDPNWRLARDVREDQLIRLATVPDDVRLDMRVWLDVEDNQSTGWQVPVQQRVDDVWRALVTLDEWSAARGLPPAGIYWSRYFIDLLFNGRNYFGRPEWLAHYGITPGSLIGGNVVAHQYASVPIDQNMMLESEIVTGEEPDMPDCEAEKAPLISAVAYVCDDLGDKFLAESKRSNVRKTVVRQIVAEMARVREQQVGPRPEL